MLCQLLLWRSMICRQNRSFLGSRPLVRFAMARLLESGHGVMFGHQPPEWKMWFTGPIRHSLADENLEKTLPLAANDRCRTMSGNLLIPRSVPPRTMAQTAT